MLAIRPNADVVRQRRISIDQTYGEKSHVEFMSNRCMLAICEITVRIGTIDI
jgi:hypothetical protein